MLFAGALFVREEPCRKGIRKLREIYGPLLRETQAEPWEYSEYYRNELGWPIMRKFVFFKRAIGQEGLKDIKLRTNQIEAEMYEDGKRQINIDPGYLTLAKVVLASTKDYSHRVYMGGGIFVEATLIYKAGTFQPHIFTYPDYREERNIRMFNEMRGAFKDMIQ
jgi:hypothetical protein